MIEQDGNRAARAASAVVAPPHQGRRHPRRRIAGAYVTYLDAVSSPHRGEILDIGCGGISFRGWHLLRGFYTSVELELPGAGRQIQARGQIVWTDATGRAGVRFLSLPMDAENSLREWLALQPEKAGEPQPGQARSVDEAMVPSGRRQLAPVADRILGLAEFGWRALALSGADGLALALPAGGEIVCAASFGMAPPAGVIIQPDAGLAGECLRTSVPVQCGDAARDCRIPPRVAAQGFRSAALVPVLTGERAVGLIAAFSSYPYAFGEDHLALLHALAGLIGNEKTASARVQARPLQQPWETRPALPLPARSPGNGKQGETRLQVPNPLVLRYLSGEPAPLAGKQAASRGHGEWRPRARSKNLEKAWAYLLARGERLRQSLALPGVTLSHNPVAKDQ